jgi:exopolysaccharide biosynthesis polyprenyl glycosylphosphotransferase
MTPILRRILIKIFKLFDLLVMALSFGMATAAAHHQLGTVSFDQFLTMRIKVQNVAIFLGLLLVWNLIFALFGLYRSRRLSPRWEEIIDVIKATSFATLVIFIAAVLFRIEMVTPVFIAAFWTLSSGTIILSRVILRYALKMIRSRGRNLRYMLIAGTNIRAVQFAREIEKEAGFGYHVVGFVDNEWICKEHRMRDNHQLIKFDDFADFLRKHVVDEVVIFLPMNSFYQQYSQIIAHCEKQGIIVRIHSGIFNTKFAGLKTEQSANFPVITIYSGGEVEGLPHLIKRVIDIFISLILIIIFSPLLFITAILVKVTSPGPTFFIQERVGLNKRRFRLYKYRTMVVDAEQKLQELEHLNEASGPVFKITDDPRLTPVGKFLRKTSIDELPQLLNVLKGDMSLVGPRPLPVRDYKGFDRDWHRRRFSVRPGITCLWQVSGRSSLTFEKWMELDMEYIDHWSPWLDFKILVKTIPAVLHCSGAR